MNFETFPIVEPFIKRRYLANYGAREAKIAGAGFTETKIVGY